MKVYHSVDGPRPRSALSGQRHYTDRSVGIWFVRIGLPVRRLLSLACDLNAHVCDRKLLAANPDQLKSLTTNVSGSLPTPGTWRISGAIDLLVPDVILLEDIDWSPYEIAPGMSLASVVVDDLGGCVSFDDKCRKLIGFYNQSLGQKPFDENFHGTLLLPVLTITVSTNVANASESKATTGLVNINSVAVQKLQDDFGNESLTENPLGKRASVPNPPPPSADQVFKQLQHNLVGAISIGRFDTPATEAPVVAGPVLEPMDVQQHRFRLADLLSFPPQMRQWPYSADLQGGVGVGILDSRIDEAHCAIDYGHVSNIGNFSGPPDLGPRSNCKLNLTGSEDVDHGTHVLGIIGARYPIGGGTLPLGLNPYARIATMEVDFRVVSRTKRALEQ